MALPKPVTKTGGTFLGKTFAELVEERALEIAELKIMLMEADIEGYDNIALVRYLCGFGTVANTFAAIQAAQGVLRDKAHVIEAAAAGRPLEFAASIEKYQKLTFWQASEDRAMYIVRVAHTDCKQLLKVASEEEIIDYALYFCRLIWQWVDGTSRKLGRVCKYDAIVDFGDYSFSDWRKVPPPAYRKAMNRTTEFSELLHPLAQGSNVLLGFPAAATAKKLLGMIKPLLPKSMTNSLLCPGNRRKQSISQCPYVKARFPTGGDALPVFLGGTCPVTGSCVETAALDAVDELQISQEKLEGLVAALAENDDSDAASALKTLQLQDR